MSEQLTLAAEQTVALSLGSTAELSRVVITFQADCIVVTMLLKELEGYGALMKDPLLKDRLMELFFLALRSTGCVLPDAPRFSFRFSVDL